MIYASRIETASRRSPLRGLFVRGNQNLGAGPEHGGEHRQEQKQCHPPVVTA
jgi:hypothetical protein